MSIDAGSYVRHRSHDEWGLGKVIARTGDGKDTIAHVFFRDRRGTSLDDARRAVRIPISHMDRLEVVEGVRDPLLEALPPFAFENGVYLLPHERVTLAMARERFLDLFGGGFNAPKYLGDQRSGERLYKVRAHELFESLLGGGKLEGLLAEGQVAQACDHLLEVVDATNLLHSTERIAFKDSLQDRKAAETYLSTLARYLAAPAIDATTFEPFAKAFLALPRMGAARVHSWVVFSAVPFLAQPWRHIELKPTETQVAANRLAFDLHYDPKPNWTTYSRLLDLAALLRAELADLGCRDMIDVQSFIWATCGGYDPKPKKTQCGDT